MPSDSRSEVGQVRSGDVEAALRDSEAFYHSLVENLPQNILRKDLDGRFTFANSRVCQTIGLSREQILGKTDFDLFPAELATKYQSDDRRVLESGENYDVVEPHEAPSGKLYVQVLKTPIRDTHGAIIGIQVIFWDVTERKLMEEQLHCERELLRVLLDACPDSIYFKDTQSRFLRISRSLADQFGLADPAEAIGKSDLDFFTLEHARAALAHEREIIRTGAPQIGRLEKTMCDGEVRWTTSTKLPWRDAQGTIVGTFGVSRNVTELKRAEAELVVARDAALESVRLKAEFLANMSHEIRTPLNAVIGMTGLLLDTPLDAEQEDFARTVHTSADLLLGIVNDILDFSKIEAGKMTIETIDFDLGQIIEDTADLIADRAQSKGIELATWMPPHAPKLLRGDPGRLRQVLANLISNAVKFTEQGEVVVQVGLVRETTQHATVRIEVRDTGIGISPAVQARLFNAFTQADGSMTRRYGGTGLGLAICKQLVVLMGGEIGVDSVPGHGSTFWFSLTLEKQSTVSAAALAEPALLDNLRVLIVDDNATNRLILERQFAAWRMRHESATSGPEALAYLYRALTAGDPIALVVLDMQMPDMDGLAVARAIKADPKLRDTRIVILTSLGYHPDESNFRAIGISAHLTKPVKQSRLLDSLVVAVSESARPTDAPRPERRGAAVSVMPPKHQSLRVLVAEDNAVNQKVALRLLQKLGYSAEAVANGHEVLSAIRLGRYDVVLMDCQMPEMDGYEATTRIRQLEASDPSWPRHRIIALTAHTLEGDRERCLEAGMDDYLSKPIRIVELAQVLSAQPAVIGVTR